MRLLKLYNRKGFLIGLLRTAAGLSVAATAVIAVMAAFWYKKHL